MVEGLARSLWTHIQRNMSSIIFPNGIVENQVFDCEYRTNSDDDCALRGIEMDSISRTTSERAR